QQISTRQHFFLVTNSDSPLLQGTHQDLHHGLHHYLAMHHQIHSSSHYTQRVQCLPTEHKQSCLLLKSLSICFLTWIQNHSIVFLQPSILHHKHLFCVFHCHQNHCMAMQNKMDSLLE